MFFLHCHLHWWFTNRSCRLWKHMYIIEITKKNMQCCYDIHWACKNYFPVSQSCRSSMVSEGKLEPIFQVRRSSNLCAPAAFHCTGSGALRFFEVFHESPQILTNKTLLKMSTGKGRCSNKTSLKQKPGSISVQVSCSVQLLILI